MSPAASSLGGRARPNRLAGEVRLAWRDLRGSMARFTVFIACLALGVLAISGVGALRDGILQGFDRQGRVLLGGDVAASRVHQRITTAERAFLANEGSLAEIATLRAMARNPAGAEGQTQAMIELKAVDGAYPLVGAVELDDGSALAMTLGAGGAAVDQLLLDRLGLETGDRVRVGTHDITIARTIVREPDKLASQASYGPRVLISIATLEKTGLAAPGSLTRWHYRILLPGGETMPAEELAAFSERLRTGLPQAGFTAADRRDPTPGARRAITRVGQFLTLIGLTTLIIGGIGVASAVTAYLAKKRTAIATLRSLGATSGAVLRIYGLEVLAVSVAGIVFGLAGGMLVPGLIAMVAGDALPLTIETTMRPETVGLAVAYGLLVAVLFVAWPLGGIERIEPAELFRTTLDSRSDWPRLPYVATTLAALVALIALAILTSPQWYFAATWCGAALALFGLFAGLGRLVQWLSARAPRWRRTELRIALRNLGGPGSLAVSTLLALGTGLSLLVTVTLIDRSLTAELAAGLPEKAPSYYFLDIGKEDGAEFEARLAALAPGSRVVTAPMLRGRLVSLKGIPVEKIEAPAEAEWVLSGDRGLTFADAVPAGAAVIEGAWWPPGYDGEPLVSFDVELARHLKLEVGDRLEVNVLGRNVAAKIANLRTVRWEQLSINFVMIFSPNTLRAAPYNTLATLTLPEATTSKTEARLVQTLAIEFPEVTSIRVRDAIEAFGAILRRIMTAVRVAALVTLLAGALVLAGALATAERRRSYQAVLLKTLGASQRQILGIHLAEYLILSSIAAVVALLLGSIAAYLVTWLVMEIPFAFSAATVTVAILGSLALVLAVGLGSTARTLSARPGRYLVSE